jgi:Tfp pilus assembly protein PilV
MKKYKINNQSGFTLIEILLYMVLSTVMVILMGGIGANVFSGFVKAKAAEELQYNTQFVTEKIRSLASQAESIAAPVAGETASVLSLVMSDTSKNPTIIDLVDGRVRLKEGEGEAQFISGSSMDISVAEFSNVTYNDGIGSLRVVLQIGPRNREDRVIYFASTTVYTTVNLQYP